MTLSEKYRLLPEANAIPDEIYEIERNSQEFAALDKRRMELQTEAFELHERLLSFLRKNWTREELKKAGWL